MARRVQPLEDRLMNDSTASALRMNAVNTTRSMVLYAIGACAGLALAGIDLFTAPGTATRHIPAENIASVNQQPVLRSDFITQVETETGRSFKQSSRAEQLRVLDSMVKEELLVQRGLELGFAETDQTTRNALAAVVGQQMTAEVATSLPGDPQLLDYYQRHRERYATEGTMTVQHLLLPQGGGLSSEAGLERAREAVKELRSGAPVAAVIEHYGLREARPTDEDFYFAAKVHLGNELFEVARTLGVGAVSEPVRGSDGVHLLRMVRHAPPVPGTFEQFHDQVLSDLRTEREERITASTLKFLRDRAVILIASDYTDDYKP
jgi:parvulin-like peptidyl-prolyl isomerase